MMKTALMTIAILWGSIFLCCRGQDDHVGKTPEAAPGAHETSPTEITRGNDEKSVSSGVEGSENSPSPELGSTLLATPEGMAKGNSTSQPPRETEVFSKDEAPVLPPVEKGLVFNGPRDKARVAITFDACETAKPARWDQKIWDILVAKDAKATIFLGGKWMESHPEQTVMIGQNPNIEIANHSYIHPDFTKISEARVREEIKRTQDVQWRMTGRQGITFRFPYGYYDDKSLAVAAEMGVYPIQWDVVSGDPSKSVKAKPMAREVLNKAQNGSIIIFHINGRGWNTAEALPEIIDGLRAGGFELVTVSELMGYPTPASMPVDEGPLEPHGK